MKFFAIFLFLSCAILSADASTTNDPPTCTRDCECDSGNCDMDACIEDCECDGGGCSMPSCKEECECDGGNCSMPSCVENCDCDGLGCDAPMCTKNCDSITDLSNCGEYCNCDQGGCDFSTCTKDCSCNGGGCSFPMCVNNCHCDQGCDMPFCAMWCKCYNGGCTGSSEIITHSTAGESSEQTMSPEEEMISEVGETILSAVEAAEESVTGVTSGASGLVTQIMNEILGTESPTSAPSVFVPEETDVDKMIGKVTDTVNTIAEGTGDVLNEIFVESPTPGP